MMRIFAGRCDLIIFRSLKWFLLITDCTIKSLNDDGDNDSYHQDQITMNDFPVILILRPRWAAHRWGAVDTWCTMCHQGGNLVKKKSCAYCTYANFPILISACLMMTLGSCQKQRRHPQGLRTATIIIAITILLLIIIIAITIHLLIIIITLTELQKRFE